jgi:hypothetical protein
MTSGEEEATVRRNNNAGMNVGDQKSHGVAACWR